MPIKKSPPITVFLALCLVGAMASSCQTRDLTTPVAEAETTTQPLPTASPLTPIPFGAGASTSQQYAWHLEHSPFCDLGPPALPYGWPHFIAWPRKRVD